MSLAAIERPNRYGGRAARMGLRFAPGLATRRTKGV